jgi:hypothetical protein
VVKVVMAVNLCKVWILAEAAFVRNQELAPIAITQDAQ